MPEENISAIATPPGKGGVAIIRLSGGSPLSIAEKMFVPAGTVAVKDFEPYRLYPGRIDGGTFCFGTNDLTQMTFGFSRDDAGKFLNAYYDTKIFENDPFAKLDQAGVGKLMEMAIKLGKPVNPKLHVGICGEHGGDPSSVEFCHKIGLDYVSCSPFRVPIARLAAAQAAIADK